MTTPGQNAAAGREQGPVRSGDRLADLTTFRLGGPCRAVVTCATVDQLQRVVRELAARDEPFRVMGGGSNLLVSDHGLDETIVRYVADEPRWELRDGLLSVPGSVALDALASAAAEKGWGGLVFASGIPGTLGGAIAGNAGAFGETISDHLVEVTLMDRTGEARRVKPGELDFDYRTSALQRSGDVVVAATLRVSDVPVGELRERREEILRLRRERHPDWRRQPCAGSVFRNVDPASPGEHRRAAGWFLEQVGAKDFVEGGAAVFDHHANIIVKASDACRAQDVLDLMVRMRDAVQRKFGITLVPELRAWGAFVNREMVYD